MAVNRSANEQKKQLEVVADHLIGTRLITPVYQMIIIIIVISVGVLKNSAWSPEPHFVSSLGMSRNTFISEKSPSALLPAPPSSISPSCSSPITAAAPAPSGGVSPADQTAELGGWRDAAVFVFAVPGFGLMYN